MTFLYMHIEITINLGKQNESEKNHAKTNIKCNTRHWRNNDVDCHEIELQLEHGKDLLQQVGSDTAGLESGNGNDTRPSGNCNHKRNTKR